MQEVRSASCIVSPRMKTKNASAVAYFGGAGGEEKKGDRMLFRDTFQAGVFAAPTQPRWATEESECKNGLEVALELKNLTEGITKFEIELRKKGKFLGKEQLQVNKDKERPITDAAALAALEVIDYLRAVALP